MTFVVTNQGQQIIKSRILIEEVVGNMQSRVERVVSGMSESSQYLFLKNRQTVLRVTKIDNSQTSLYIYAWLLLYNVLCIFSQSDLLSRQRSPRAKLPPHLFKNAS